MPRYRSDTPAARLRDAPARARRRTRRAIRTAAGAYLLLCLAALTGLVVTAPGSSPTRPGAAQESAQWQAGVIPPAKRAVPDGLVEDTSHAARRLPVGWSEVRPLLNGAVREAQSEGHELAVCVLAIDSADEEMVCAGDDEPRYAASVIKVAYAVGALEAWRGDPTARTPYGRLGDLLENAITVSDNEAANLLYDLSVEGPTAPKTDDPIKALNTIADRVDLADEFHTGGAFRYEWTGDWSRVSARGSVAYLNELVRAADGRGGLGDRLTSPVVARHVLALMLEQERNWKLPGRLPAGSVANKTGETDTESHDIAVVNTASGRYAVAAIGSANGMYSTPDLLMSELGSEVVEALGGPVRF